MRLFQLIQHGCVLAVAVRAQSTTITGSATLSLSISTSGVTEVTLPTGSYTSYSSTLTLSQSSRFGALGSMSSGASSMGADNMTATATDLSQSQTFLQGTNFPTTSAINGTISRNATASASSTSSAAQPTNTTPCNNYAEFCNRKYSNITMVCAHNSPFNKPGNIASNQELSVTTQLNDGVRMLQAQTHVDNGTMYLCHTSCNILNAGTLTSYLSTVNTWVISHPYDVVTILIGNGDYVPVTDYIAPIQDSGILQFLYTPPKIPMSLSDWPTLGTMILAGQRIVLFMDYDADQTRVPYILDEFSQLWETPFDPVDRTFPCTIQRPPGLSNTDAPNRLFLMNHNLNQEVSLLGNSLLIPLKPLLPETNAVEGYGSLGAAALTCAETWGRAPNFLNVDFYNNGSGSVFEAAARLNNVKYNMTCCGAVTNGAQRAVEGGGVGRWGSVMAAGVIISVVLGLV